MDELGLFKAGYEVDDAIYSSGWDFKRKAEGRKVWTVPSSKDTLNHVAGWTGTSLIYAMLPTSCGHFYDQRKN